MPIVDVEMVEDPNGSAPDKELPQALADALGRVFGVPPGETWVRVRRLPRRDYAENGGPLPDGIRPLFVTVLKSHRPESDALRTEVSAVTDAVAKACRRPRENVHVLYLPEAAGRLAFGGEFVEGG